MEHRRDGLPSLLDAPDRQARIREIALSEQLGALPADAPFPITRADWFGYTLSTWEEIGIVLAFAVAMLAISIRAISTTE